MHVSELPSLLNLKNVIIYRYTERKCVSGHLKRNQIGEGCHLQSWENQAEGLQLGEAGLMDFSMSPWFPLGEGHSLFWNYGEVCSLEEEIRKM